MQEAEAAREAARAEEASVRASLVDAAGKRQSISRPNPPLPRPAKTGCVGPDRIQWVLTVGIMTLAVIMPVTGYLGDTFGYKRMYFLALSVFTLGSALCGHPGIQKVW